VPAPSPSTRHLPLFWRLFIPNACVLVAACVLLWLEPANGRLIALLGGLAIMLVANILLMRRAFSPLARLTRLMQRIDPLRPGERLPAFAPKSEVTVLAEAFNDMLDRIEAERRGSARRALSAQELERRHVAAELHDEIGQRLTALVMHLGRIERAVARGEHAELPTARQATVEIVDAVRHLARSLRPEALDELGLIPAISNLCERVSEGSGLNITRTLPRDVPSLSADTELVIYRVVQESLTNTMRHARASRVDVALTADDGGAVELVVLDDGQGLPATAVQDARGGIRNMRERAVAIGADVRIETPPAGGTRVWLGVTTDEAQG